jgi:glyoxylase-like metal-dependent hydrolase (beta-lactamase superfamily II)
MALEVSAARVDRVDEMQFEVLVSYLTDDADFVAERIAPLPSSFLDPETTGFQFTCQSWVISVDGLKVLVDPCSGNGRTGRPPVFNDLATPYLERLAAVGAPSETIDVVFCTHLHYDHCGWNTQWVDGCWVPTFPNADYVFVDTEYARWDPNSPNRHPNEFNVSVFDESVRPVVDARLSTIVSLPHAISPSLTIEAAPGHTVGHAMLQLTSGDQRAYFVGDVVHHPVQIFRPDLHLPGCDDLQQAIATRRTVFSRVCDEGALMFPAHFPAPHHGRVELDDRDEFAFVPGHAAMP